MYIAINTIELGTREVYRLTEFVQFMINEHKEKLSGECLFSYDTLQDEPSVLFMNEPAEKCFFWASDYNVAFNIFDKIEKI